MTSRPSACVFCGGREGRPYFIEPFGHACRSCTDSFFTSRPKKGWGRLTEADVRGALAKSLGGPYKGGKPLALDVSDTGAETKLTVVGRGFPDRAGGLGVYHYQGEYRKRVFISAHAEGDQPRPRLAWHLDEWRRVAKRVHYVVWEELDHIGETKSWWVITTQRAAELARTYRTPFGDRIGPPLVACANYGPTWDIRLEPAGLPVLEELAKVGTPC